MTADIVNLRRARKAKQRHEAEGEAAANRIKFGRAKAERKASEAERDRAARSLDGVRRHDGSATEGSDT